MKNYDLHCADIALRVNNLRSGLPETFMAIFFSIIPMDFWELLANSVTDTMIKSYKSTKLNPIKAVTPLKMLQFYGNFLKKILMF